MVTITVLTAALNAGKTIGRLASDLQNQTDGEFVWMIVDGGSTDDTLAQVRAAMNGHAVILQEGDFGIYDALNKGLHRCTSTHYLVIGADDRLDHDAIAQYRRLADETSADIVAASVRDNGRTARPNRGRSWLRGQNAYISHHSAGTLIRRELHDRFGYYSSAFPIAADQLFIKTAVQRGCRIVYAPEFIAGEFSRDGVSSTRYLACLFEFTLVQMRTERSRGVQLLLLFWRLIRHWREVIR